MDKNGIKEYAIWAREEFKKRVTQKALEYGITKDKIVDVNADNIGEKLLTSEEKVQRQWLIKEIKEKGFDKLIDEVAYTWFNRFCALRFMEVNGYLPTHVRVFTDDENKFRPQILDEAMHLDIEGLDIDRIYEYKKDNKIEDLYEYLLIKQCNELSKILPGIFPKRGDYTELLLPNNLLREGSIIEQMIKLIPEEKWNDEVQIIGWLYQYYISDPKDELINARKKYKSEDVPFVTQLFTPDWIVRFMVENSLGRLWLEGHPDDNLKSNWNYYLEESEQDKEVNIQLNKIKEEHKSILPEQIKIMDPCMGSGHILVYAFDVLMQIYESYGYSTREAVQSIVEKNLWGLDIDDRATQLSYFSIMMKARKYDKRFFSRNIQPHVYTIIESNCLDKGCIDYFVNNDMKIKYIMDTLVKELNDAKEYGSILNVTEVDFNILYNRFEEIKGLNKLNMYSYSLFKELLPFIQVAQALAQKYDVVCTNPPYMNSSYMPTKLKKFVQNEYPDFKNDLFAVFTNRVVRMTKENGHIGLLMPYVWMFISSYEKMRKWVNNNTNITSLVQLEYNAFEAACVPVATLTMCKTTVGSKGEYIRLSEFRGSENQSIKTLEAINNPSCGYRFTASQNNFPKIPGSPIAYWVNNNVIKLFEDNIALGNIASPRQGMATCDNDRFIRLWHEINKNKMGVGIKNINEAKNSLYKWFPYNKGGSFRKWYGNNEYVVNWENDGYEVKQYAGGLYKSFTRTIKNINYYFRKGITWSSISSGAPSFRYFDVGYIFSNSGQCVFTDSDNKLKYILALNNSNVTEYILKILSPTMGFESGYMKKIPFIEKNTSEVIDKVDENISISKNEWDSFEDSWDFKKHPIIEFKSNNIENSFKNWSEFEEKQFNQLKLNEEELNRIFIDIYGLQDELTPEVKDKDITIRKADLTRDIKSFISYFVGCIFGRYSLDVDGLIYAGGKWDESKYTTFKPDKDNIIPICDDEYFEDDIVGRFIKFIEILYGSDTLEENLKFISDTLGGRGTPREVIRNYFIKDFYTDHCKIYKKRPIYWLFDSGRKNGFKALMYVHRYQPDTIARLRTDYVHEQQARYRNAIESIEKNIESASRSEKVKLTKKLNKLKEQEIEIREYEEKVHHLADQMISIDLDDGVKHNYEIFKDILAKIK